MSRQVFLLGVGLCLIALAFAVTDHLLTLQPGVTEANVKRIRKGMSEEEVQAILGRAPDPFDDELANRRVFEEVVRDMEDIQGIPSKSTLYPGNSVKIDWDGLDIRDWEGEFGTARILFRHQQVLLAVFYPSSVSRPTILQRLRSYLGQ
jgi:hypothetical protein